MPYSGPASAYGVIGKTEEAYFKKINDEGGINGRKINFISYDDGYSPPKAVEQARKLVESDEVLVVFNPLGTPSNTAIQKYLNSKKVPQLFVATGATKWNDPKDFPWTMGWQPSYQSEARIYAKFLLKEKPNAKIAILYQNDDFGKDYLKGLKDGLGAKALDDHRRGKLRDLGADHRLPHRQAEGHRRRRLHQHHHAEIRRAGDQEDRRDRLEAAALPDQRLGLGRQRDEAGRLRERAGHHLGGLRQGRADPQWKNDPGMKKFDEFLDKYYPEGNRIDGSVVYGYGVGADPGEGAEDVRRRPHPRQRHEAGGEPEGLRARHACCPASRSTLSATDFAPIEQLQMMRFKGENWDRFGDIISGDVTN